MHEFECRRIRFPVDEDQIRFDMAIPVVMSVSDERMIAVTRRQGRVRGEQCHHRPQVLIQGRAMPSGPDTFVVPLKVGGPLHRPHGDR